MYYIILTIMFKSGALYLNIACCHLLPNLFKDTPYITTRKRFTVQNCNRQTINYLSFRGLLALNKQLLCFSENRNFTHRKKMTHQAVIMQPTIFYLNNLKCQMKTPCNARKICSANARICVFRAFHLMDSIFIATTGAFELTNKVFNMKCNSCN